MRQRPTSCQAACFFAGSSRKCAATDHAPHHPRGLLRGLRGGVASCSTGGLRRPVPDAGGRRGHSKVRGILKHLGTGHRPHDAKRRKDM